VLRRFGIHAGVRPDIGHAEGLAVALEPVAKDVERALQLQLFGKAVEHGCGGFAPEQRLERRPLGRLAVFQKAGDIVGEQREGFVIVLGSALPIATRADQTGLDGGFEIAFRVSRHTQSLDLCSSIDVCSPIIERLRGSQSCPRSLALPFREQNWLSYV
jgi:hypothetical protein